MFNNEFSDMYPFKIEELHVPPNFKYKQKLMYITLRWKRRKECSKKYFRIKCMKRLNLMYKIKNHRELFPEEYI